MSDEKIVLDIDAEAPKQPQEKPGIFDKLTDSLSSLSTVTPRQSTAFYDGPSHHQAPSLFILLNPEDHPVGTQLLFRAMKPGSGLIEARIADWSPGGRVFLEYRDLPRSNHYIPVGWYEVQDVRAVEILRPVKTEDEKAAEE